MGSVILLFDAWHVNTIWRWLLCNFSSCKIFLTLFSDSITEVSSSIVFSCHHETFGNGRPEIKWEKRKLIYVSTYIYFLIRVFFWFIFTRRNITTYIIKMVLIKSLWCISSEYKISKFNFPIIIIVGAY